MQKCILKLILDNDLYDAMTDTLLIFPARELEFMGHSVQAHTRSLSDINEQVSGFKQKMVIEITTDTDEAREIYKFVKEILTEASFEGQLFSLLDF